MVELDSEFCAIPFQSLVLSLASPVSQGMGKEYRIFLLVMQTYSLSFPQNLFLTHPEAFLLVLPIDI